VSAKNDNITMGFDRLNALFAWWGVPSSTGNGNIDAPMKRFQSFASDLQRAYGEAYSRQMEALFTANERLGSSVQELLRCRQPQDVLAAESNILAILLEGSSQHAQTWVELTQKVQDCCAAIAREAAEEVHKQVNRDTSTKSSAKAAQSPAKSADAGRHLAHA
jgi:hypothetical protein